MVTKDEFKELKENYCKPEYCTTDFIITTYFPEKLLISIPYKRDYYWESTTDTRRQLVEITPNGICYYGNGDVYNGEWKKSKKNGKGIIVYKSGNKYDGYWEDGKKSGKGIYYFKNGDFFKGEWKNGKKNGKGLFYYKDKNLEEEGLR